MSSTGAKVARRVVADALKVNWSAIELRFALRCTVGIAIPLIAASFAGAPLDGASAAYGALVTGLASRQGVYRTRVGVMLVAGATLALSGFAGAITGPVPWLNVALLAVWSLVFGVIGSLGRAATVVAVNGCVAFVLFSNPPYDTANPWVQASMVFAGSALQMVLLVLIWPLTRFGAERAALSASYASLAQYATGLRADDLGLPDTASVAAVSNRLAVAARLRRIRRSRMKRNAYAQRSRRSRPNSICSANSGWPRLRPRSAMPVMPPVRCSTISQRGSRRRGRRHRLRHRHRDFRPRN